MTRSGEVTSIRVGVGSDGEIYIMFLDEKGGAFSSNKLGRPAAQWLASELFRAIIHQEAFVRDARVAAEEKLASK